MDIFKIIASLKTQAAELHTIGYYADALKVEAIALKLESEHFKNMYRAIRPTQAISNIN